MKKRLIIAAVISALLIVLTLGTACNLMKTDSEKSYTVTFMNGDSVLSSVSVKPGETVNTAYVPVAPEGYVFDGWFSDAELTVPVNSFSAEADVKLYARFLRQTFTVRFVDKDGNLLKSETVNYGASVAAPDAPVVDDWKFTGWDKAFDNVKSNLIVTALYNQNQYALSFKYGNEIISTKNVYGRTTGESLSADAMSARSLIENIPAGFDFDCWVDDVGREVVFTASGFSMPSNDYDVFAKLKLAQPGAVTAENKTYVYGSDNASALFKAEFDETVGTGITYSYGWYLNDVKLADGKTFTATDYNSGRYIFTVKVTASAENMNPVFVSTTAILTVDRGTLSGFSANDVTVTYDNTAHDVTVNGTLPSDTVKFSLNKINWVSSRTFTNAGQYFVYYKVSRNNYFDYISDNKVIVTVNKAALTVTADDKIVKYGDALPDFTATISGFIGTDDETVVKGTPAFSSTDSTKAIGKFDIVPLTGTLSSDNYNFVFVKGMLSVDKRDLTVTADNLSVTYGDNVPPFSATFEGFISGEDSSVLGGAIVYQCDYTATSPVNTYSVTPYGLTSDNYNVTFKAGVLTVDKKDASVTVNAVNPLTYGDTAPVYSATVSGNLVSDTINYSIDCDYVAGDKTGVYPITVTPGNNPNYNVTVIGNNASLTVGKKAITVSETARVGYTGSVWTKSNWNVTGIYSADVFGGTLSTTSAEIGIYTASGKLGTDFVWNGFDVKRGDISYLDCYDVSYAVSVEIFDAVIPNSVSGYSGTYDGLGHSISVTSPLVGAIITYSTDGATYSAENPAFTNVGSYTVYYKITAEGRADANGNATVVISPATLAVTADNKSVTFGDAIPAYSATFAGFVNGETAAVLGGAIGYICDYTATSPVNTYSVTPYGLTSDNYIVTFKAGALTVDQKSAAVIWTMNGAPYTYDGTNQASKITAVYKDINGADVTASVTFNGLTEFINAGDYILAATTADTNYSLMNTSSSVNMAKGTYSGISALPAFSGTTYSSGLTLASFTLPADYRWKSATTPVHCNGTVGNDYPVLYNRDSDNYNDYELNVTVILNKAVVTIGGGTIQAYDYTGSTVAFDTSLLTNDKNVNGTYTTDVGKGTYTVAGTYGFNVTFDATDYTGSVKCYLKVKGVSDGTNTYTIEDALLSVTSGTLTLQTSTSFADEYNSCYNTAIFTLAGGVTLVLPSSEDSSTAIGSPTYGAGAKNYVDNLADKIQTKLTVLSGISFNVDGKVLVQGLLGCEGGPLEGHTSGIHSQIINDGTITLNSGATLDCRGYIKGTGMVYINNGASVYSPFVVKDFRGGTNTVTVYRKGNISPFNVYELPNIQCGYTLYHGATYTIYLDLYASSKHNTSTKVIIGTTDGVIQLGAGAYIVKEYSDNSNNLNDKTTIAIVGNITLASLSLTLSGVTANMSDVFFPIPYTYDVVIGDGSTATTLTAQYKYKIMPGANVLVSQNATVNLSGSLIVYSNFTDTAFGGIAYPAKEAATLTVNGTLNVSGSLGGQIRSTNVGAQVKTGGTLSVTSKEGNSGSTSSFQALINSGEFITVATITETATLVNGDGATVTPTTNKTYTYNGTTWE